MIPYPVHNKILIFILLFAFHSSALSSLPEIEIQLTRGATVQGKLTQTQSKRIVVNKSRHQGSVSQSWELKKIEALHFNHPEDQDLSNWTPDIGNLINLADIIAWFPLNQQKTILNWVARVSDLYERTRLLRRMLKGVENSRIRQLLILNLCRFYLELELPGTALELIGQYPNFTHIFNSSPSHFKVYGEACMNSGDTPAALQAYASALIAFANPADEDYQAIIEFLLEHCVSTSQMQSFAKLHHFSKKSSP